MPTSELLDLLADLDQIEGAYNTKASTAPATQSPLARWQLHSNKGKAGEDGAQRFSDEEVYSPDAAAPEQTAATSAPGFELKIGSDNPEDAEETVEAAEQADADTAPDSGFPTLPVYVAPELSALIQQFQGRTHQLASITHTA